MTSNLEGIVGANYDKILSEYFVREHLQPAVALAIATKRRLQTRRQGYKFAARPLSRILRMVRAAGSRSTAGPQKANLYQKAIWLLWSSERENSFLTLENRRGTPAFPVLEVDGILFLSGRKLSDGPPFDQPSAHQQDQHLITPGQLSQYMVPVVNPWCSLGGP